MSEHDAAAILAKIDAAEPITPEEMGYLLPKLAEGKQTVAYHPLRCHNKMFSCMYDFRGEFYLWLCGHIGYDQSGIVKVPAAAIKLSPELFMTPMLAGITRCHKCGHGWLVGFLPPNEVVARKIGTATFAEVAE
jgi:hypothetical protein